MQIGSPTLSPPLQALGSAALNKYQAGGDFSFTVGDAGDSASNSSGTGAASSGDQLSGSFRSGSLIAVGTMGSNGQLNMFSADQIQSEEDMVANMRQLSFADSLQNFLSLAQAGSPDGQLAASSYSDEQHFIGDNGLVSAYFASSYSLTPAGDGQPGGASGATYSVSA